MSATPSKMHWIRSIGRSVRAEFIEDTRYILVGDPTSTAVVYSYAAILGAVVALFFWPSWVAHGTVLAVLLALATTFLAAPALGLTAVFAILLLYNIIDAVADISQDARQSRRDIRRAIWCVSRLRALFTRDYKKLKSVPLFPDMSKSLAGPCMPVKQSKDFIRFEKLKSDVLASHQFLVRGGYGASYGLWTRVLMRRATHKQVSADRRLGAMYKALYTSIVNEYTNSLSGRSHLDTTDSVWVLPSRISSIYSVRVIENFAAVAGTIYDDERRPAPHVKLVFSPAWVCAMVSQLERNQRSGFRFASFFNLHETFRHPGDIVCVPLRGADSETIAALYDPTGHMSDLNTLVDVALHV